MSYIGQAPGLGQRSVFRFVALQGQTVFSGRDAAGLVLAYAVGTSTLVAVNGRLLSGPDYTATDGSTLTIAAPLSAGDEVIVMSDAPFNPANTYTTNAADLRFTRKRNRIVNPGMRISQENDNTLLSAALQLLYASDSFFMYRNSGGAATFQRIQQATPGGSPFRVRTTITTANSSPGAGDRLFVGTRIEGNDVADLRWGTAAAKAITLRIGVNFSVAGTYPVLIKNFLVSRSWLGTFTISPGEVGLDVVKSFVVPGETSGTWETGVQGAFDVEVMMLAGSNFLGSPGWNNGDLGTVAGCTNFMAFNGATFDLFDVGLYEGTVLPTFELPSYEDDLKKCQRYFQWMPTLVGTWDTSTRYNGAASFPTPMRVSPTVSFVSSGQGVTRAYVGDYPVSGVFFSETTTTTIIAALTTTSADPGYVGFTKGNLKVALNARL